MTPEEYAEFIYSNGGDWVTYSTERLDSILAPMEKSPTAVAIAVFVGGIFAGYVFGSVVDGILIRITGKSGSQHVSDAIPYLLNKKVPANKKIYLPGKVNCDIYPPNSQEYFRCKNGK